MTDTLRDGRRHDFFIVDNAIFDMGLSPFELSIYCALARHADKDGVSWPGVARLAEMTSMSDRKARECLGKLQELNLIDIAPNFGPNGGQTSNTYILYSPAPHAQDASPPLHHVHTPPARGADKQYQSEQDEVMARQDARIDNPIPNDDPEFSDAVSKLTHAKIGGMNGQALIELSALWSEACNGRRAWLDDAIRVAQANKAKSPVYAIRVLANALSNNERPGQVPERKPSTQRGGVDDATLDRLVQEALQNGKS